MNLTKLIPLTKIDAAKREVWGCLAAEVLDRDGEIFDYDSSVPLIKAWSDEIAQASGGQSLGNLRAMHGAIAAGKVIAIDFDDVHKQVHIGAKVVDDAEWAKCEEGVYTGFSIGGSYANRWPDPLHKGVRRYTAQPVEASLADSPACPAAMFSLVKTDGTTELRKFQKIAAREDTSPKAGAHQYGDVPFADPTNKKYPIDTEAHIRAAWNYINKPRNAGQYSAQDAAAIRARIVRAWKAHINPDGPPSAKGGTKMSKPSLLAKVAKLAKVSKEDIHELMDTLEELEQDQDLPKKLRKPIQSLVEQMESLTVADLKALAGDEDGDGQAAGDGADAAMGGGDEDGDDEEMQAAEKAAQADDLAKLAEEHPAVAALVERVGAMGKTRRDRRAASLKKLAKDPAVAALLAQNAELLKTVRSLGDRLENIESGPASAKGSLKVVDKGEDLGGAAEKSAEEALKITKEDSPLDAIRKVRQAGGQRLVKA